jgi:RNA methyltransferase, TrmH family
MQKNVISLFQWLFMISKKWLKLIHSLQVKKYRKLHQAFLVEGAKSVQELLSSDYQITILFTTQEFYNENIRLLSGQSFETHLVTQEELEKTGVFQSNNACLAVAVSKPNQPVFVQNSEYALVLDEIKDPGNLGTIIRIADWYGITKIICSETTTDFYNPKVIAASMGSFTRVHVYYCHLPEYLQEAANLQVYGAFLQGKDVHTVSFASSGLIVMGNESQGISRELEPFITQKIHIPRYGGAESLNVGIATAVICDNMRRICQ